MDMEVNDENERTLLNMGFQDLDDIRKALRLSKNDLTDAVGILTSEQSHPYFNPSLIWDEEMEDTNKESFSKKKNLPIYSEIYSETIEAEDNLGDQNEGNNNSENGESFEFPTTNLYELESRVFTDQWSIPYKKEESLGKCLLGATKLANEGLAEADENCKRFMERCMPEAFKKLMTSGAVHRWGPEVQEGIFNMLQLLIDLIAARLKHQPVPECLLANILMMAFDPDTEFHFKNKMRRTESWDDIFGAGQAYAVGPNMKDPYGWLVYLVNRFAQKDGFTIIQQCMEGEDIDASVMAALLQPLGICAEYLNPRRVHPLLAPALERAVKYVQRLSDIDLKNKKICFVSDLLSAVKLLCLSLWPQEVDNIDKLRLDFALRMLKSPHFNAKMNGLKEVTKLIDDSTAVKTVKTAINLDRLLDWMTENSVLSISLEGNIDQVQYCDKIKAIVECLGPKLSLDDLTKIWKMQNGQNTTVVDNILNIMAAASVKFSPEQLDHLFILIQTSWKVENDRIREKLLTLIGRIGKEARLGKTTSKVLDLLWDLAHLPALPTHLIEQALEEHLAILNDAFSVKDQVKKSYVVKCVEDIKKGTWVLPALRQLYHIAKSIIKPSFHKQDKGMLHELNKNYEVVKLVTNSLMKCHKMVVTSSGEKPITADTLVDGRYTHEEYVNVHLTFLQLILQEGDFFLAWHRARDIWDTLVTNPEACESDHETSFEWFTRGLSDLEPDTQAQLFHQKLLKLDPSKITMHGFNCVRAYFESVNLYEHKLKKSSNSVIVEKVDLEGADYFWQVALDSPDEEIANMAIDNLMSIFYINLAPRLKKDPVTLHKKFISECYKRLEAAMITLGGSAMACAISRATRTLTAMTVAEVASLPLPSRSARLLNIERLLMIAERYVLTVEELHCAPRTILPHGSSFQGYPIFMHITCDVPKQEFTLMSHSNATLSSVRQRISQQLKHQAEQIQVVANDRMILHVKDHKLLHQLEFDDEQSLIAKVINVSSSSTLQNGQVKEESNGASGIGRLTFDLEQEKMLPGVVMMSMGGHVFEMLYQLAEVEEPKITTRVRKLLRLIPTDPFVQDALDTLGTKETQRVAPETASPKMSPRGSPKKVQITVKDAPKEILRHLFDAHAPNMSPFRVLYNLEVLSSKLMPTIQDAATLTSARVFCEDFLNAGGLSLVVNVLQKDALPIDVDYETRQGCYAICLQLARYLLCGQTITGEEDPLLSPKYLPSPKKIDNTINLVSIITATAGFVPNAASRAIQTMGVSDFTETVACFMRVAWAAAAGKLHLASSNQPIREGSGFYVGGRRSRQSSSGSTTSTGSEGETQTLHAGVCVQQRFVTSKDSTVAREALELLVTCLQLRSPLLGTFYNLSYVGDFIIDILLGSPNSEIRQAASEQFHRLSCCRVQNCVNSCSGEPASPHHFLLQVLLKAPLPLWVPSSNARGAGQRILRQCTQYFDLRCKLLENLNSHNQQVLHINPTQMLEDEIAWLMTFSSSEHPVVMEIDNILLAGHLRLVRTLLTSQGIDKREFGNNLIMDLTNEFLFPASKLILDGVDNSKRLSDSFISFNPKCTGLESQVATFSVLLELSEENVNNLVDIVQQLILLHHNYNSDIAKEWEYLPPVDGRAPSGFVGLKNAGATCYMNSVIQQLYHQPSIREAILAVDDETDEDRYESAFYQFQTVFGHLIESKLQYYEPEKFWRCFRLWGQPVNVREQQDAFEFYTDLIDQLDEHLIKLGREQIFKKKFQGIFSDQKIGKDCSHRYEREELFLALNLTVKNHNLQDSLDQYVKGELLEGDNAYYCEKCKEKRNVIKRTCIKSLPPVLVIQLKRFGYDWEAGRALKFDDYFKFPWILDMEPYTADGMARREQEPKSDPELEDYEIVTNGARSINQINYELVGVVVHSGQANAGHYYSFIKDRRGDAASNANKGKWFKFNDVVVEEFDMNDHSLEAECFGGTYKANVYDSATTYPETRQRYWNGYMLFYEKVEDIRTPHTTKKSRVTILKKEANPASHNMQVLRKDSDSLSELTELVHRGEKRGLFLDKMPARIQQVVRDENLHFMQNRGIYNSEYFKFIHELVATNMNKVSHPEFANLAKCSVQMGAHFLFNTYFRSKKKLRFEMNQWVNTMETLTHNSKEACLWLMKYFASEIGLRYIKPFLLECPSREVRLAFARLLEKTIGNYFYHESPPSEKPYDELIEMLLQMLNKDVPDNLKTCTQYFWLLSMLAQMGIVTCSHLFKKDAFNRLLLFLLGPTIHGSVYKEDTLPPRRWSSLQARDFGPLHNTLSFLILHCDISPFRTTAPDKFPIRTPTTIYPEVYLKMPDEVQAALYGPESLRFIREAVCACREMSGSIQSITDMLVQCMFCNESFSNAVLKQVMILYSTVPSNEMKNIFALLLEILTLEDPLQLLRFKIIIDGIETKEGKKYDGMLAVIRSNQISDSRRSYQCIKFLVNLANKSQLAKDYLMQTPSKWQWAVNWLKKKMSEYYYNPQQSTVPLSNEDSNTKNFQRTMSAQDTLNEATALLTELEETGQVNEQDLETQESLNSMENCLAEDLSDIDT